MSQEIVRYVVWLVSKKPKLHHLWTYCGVLIFSGVATGIFYRFLFLSIFTQEVAAISAGVCAALLLWRLLCRLGLRKFQAGVTAAGSMCFAATNWPSVTIGLPETESTVVSILAVLISMPLFCREMERAESIGRQ